MIIDYHPNKGFSIGSIKFDWGEARESVREKLGFLHEEDDRTIELAQLFDDDESQNIQQRKDIYANLNNSKNSFFLIYDENQNLDQLEIHEGIKVVIENYLLKFDEDVDKYVEVLSEVDPEHIVLDEGNHLFPKLKLTISNSESIGGDGNGLAYFYASKDINHLLEN